VINVHVSYNLLLSTIRIWRKEKHLEGCPVHCFTSHFYTALSEDDPKAVTSWTARKKIDVFTKRFIFLPVNQSLHWSLCVVVNPGAILNNLKALNEAPADNEVYPCILFFDSLKAHRKQVVAGKVRNWLNSEWKRLKKAKSQEEEYPFTTSSLEVHDPRGEHRFLDSASSQSL
jgi:Ulp1 family protease